MKKSFDPKARANEIAAQLKAAEEAQAAYEATIDEAIKNAARSRVEFVEMLYEHFDIQAETTVRNDKSGQPVRDKDGEEVRVKTDKNEEKRIARLAEAFEQLVAAAERNTSKAGTDATAKPVALAEAAQQRKSA